MRENAHTRVTMATNSRPIAFIGNLPKKRRVELVAKPKRSQHDVSHLWVLVIVSLQHRNVPSWGLHVGNTVCEEHEALRASGHAVPAQDVESGFEAVPPEECVRQVRVSD